MDYPEHDKLHKIQDQSQACGEFIDWLESQGLHLCEADPESGRYWPTHRPLRGLLADFFGIDQRKIDAEKEQMIAAMRALNVS
jgi:hypothetical protein